MSGSFHLLKKSGSSSSGIKKNPNGTQLNNSIKTENNPNDTTAQQSTKFTYLDPKSQAYLNRHKPKPAVDKGNDTANSFLVPIVETEVTQVVEGLLMADKVNTTNVIGTTFAAAKNVQSLRKFERAQQAEKLNRRISAKKAAELDSIHAHLSTERLETITIQPGSQYSESLVNFVQNARENMESAEWKHRALLEENIALKKENELLKEGNNLQSIRYRYYMESAYSALRNDSIFTLDQRIFHLSVKNLLTDLELHRTSFNQQLNDQITAIAAKISLQTKTIQGLILDNETVLKFLDNDLDLEKLTTNARDLTSYLAGGCQNEKESEEMATLRTLLTEKVLEIEKFRLADNANRQLVNSYVSRCEEYDLHLQNVMKSSQSEQFKNHLNQVLSLKRQNDQLKLENASLKKIAESHVQQKEHLLNQNNLLSERLNVYLKKLIQIMLLPHMNEEEALAKIENLLQTENVDFFLKRRNMEFLRDQNNIKQNAEQARSEKENALKQLEAAHQTIEELEQKLIKVDKFKSVAGLIDLTDTSQLQHTVQQLSLILLSKENTYNVDPQTQQVIKQMFSQNFDQVMEFQLEKSEKLQAELDDMEQKLKQVTAKSVEYLNMAFYLSRLLAEICQIEDDTELKAILQHERNQIMSYFGSSSADFNELASQGNPRNIMPVNAEYAAASRRFSELIPDLSKPTKTKEENMLSDLTVLQQMGVKQLQEYLSMRIGRVEDENEKLRRKVKDTKEDTPAFAELKRQRLADEERYERLSKRLARFCGDNVFTAGENKDLIGAFSEDMMMALFIQANTIEEMINKTYDQEEDEGQQQQQQQQQQQNQSETNVESQQQPNNKERRQSSQSGLGGLNHSVIEEKPGEEDEIEDSGKKRISDTNQQQQQQIAEVQQFQPMKMPVQQQQQQQFVMEEQKNQQLLQKSSSQSSSASSVSSQKQLQQQQQQQNKQQLEQSLPQSLQQKIDPNGDSQQFRRKSEQESAVKVESYTYYNQNNQDLPQFYNKTSSLSALPQRVSDEHSLLTSQESDSSNTANQNQNVKNSNQNQIYNTSNALSPGNSFIHTQILQTITQTQVPMQKATSNQSSSLANTKIQPVSQNEGEKLQFIINQQQQQQQPLQHQQLNLEEEEVPRTLKPQRSVQEEDNKSRKEDAPPQQQEDQFRKMFLQRQKEIQESQRQKEIQELKAFGAQQVPIPLNSKDISNPRIKSSDQLETVVAAAHSHHVSAGSGGLGQYQYQQQSLTNSKHRNQQSQPRYSQDREKLLQDAFGMLSEIKGSNKKTGEDDQDKSNFTEEHYDMFFGQQEDHYNQESYGGLGGVVPGGDAHLRHLTGEDQEYQEQGSDQEEFEEKRRKTRGERRDRHGEESQDENQDDDDEDNDGHDDSLEQEAPYLNSK